MDPRFVLAIVVQESKGCVRAPTTTGSHSNPGLMQSDQGMGSCNTNDTMQDPCPQSEIHQMILDGVAGSNLDGDNLVYMLNLAAEMGTSDIAQAYYRAARFYNSGPDSLKDNMELDSPGATRCYCSDIANRLLGWVNSPTTCTLDTIG